MLCPTLETERLILRRYRESDIDATYEIITDERLSKFITFPNLTKEAELEFIKKCIDESDVSPYEKWVIELKNSGEVVGNISVNVINTKHNYCNVGYVVRYDYQGFGYASEALKRVSDYLLEERNYYLVECSCNELNLASSKVMKKAGFIKDGYVADRRVNKDGTYSGVEYYSKKKNN